MIDTALPLDATGAAAVAAVTPAEWPADPAPVSGEVVVRESTPVRS